MLKIFIFFILCVKHEKIKVFLAIKCAFIFSVLRVGKARTPISKKKILKQERRSLRKNRFLNSGIVFYFYKIRTIFNLKLKK